MPRHSHAASRSSAKFPDRRATPSIKRRVGVLSNAAGSVGASRAGRCGPRVLRKPVRTADSSSTRSRSRRSPKHGLGFADVAAVSGSDGSPVMVMLQREGPMLIVDALEGMPFATTPREEQVKAGPRGLGVALGLGVDDLDAAYTYCVESPCEITSEPRVEPYGDRVFECIDPFGYLWEISQPVAELSTEDAVDAVREEWFGPNH